MALVWLVRSVGLSTVRQDPENWIAVPKEYVTVNGGQFYARVPHLKANTTYECRAFSDGQRAKEVQFSTVDMGSFPNMGFEDWQYERKVGYLSVGKRWFEILGYW